MENNMTAALSKVALRYQGIFIDIDKSDVEETEYKPAVALVDMTKKLAECGYTLSEELLHALALQTDEFLLDVADRIVATMGENSNWAPLVKGWQIPTGEKRICHVVNAFFNLPMLKGFARGVELPCGHKIVEGTFPIERYNGCPFCGMQFKTADFVYTGQGSKLKELRLLDLADMRDIFVKLLQSPVPLDASQRDSLGLLVKYMELPEGVEVTIKENCMILISALLELGRKDEVGNYLKTPHDLLRLLWYQNNNTVQVIRPKTMIRTFEMWKGLYTEPSPYCFPTKSSMCKEKRARLAEHLRLKYSRSECRCAAKWLNNMPMKPVHMAESMHPYRGVWVRVIRALRLAEYAKKPGFEKLAELMDIFYNKKYTPWSARLNRAIVENDCDAALVQLSTRPGMFARSLFSTMLRFGTDPVLTAFREAAANVPARLVLSLGNSAEFYFNQYSTRYVRPIEGGMCEVPVNKLLMSCYQVERDRMIEAVIAMSVDVIYDHFAKMSNDNETAYIDPVLFDIPVAVGDRSRTVQDASCALLGTRFKVEGDKVRLFMQWGEGLKAQHLDMDLSCRIIYDNRYDSCAYYNLSTVGAVHSGDIRCIPDQVGTAEYIELDVPVLREAGARYVIFMSNAYSCGNLSPNMRLGWMCSENPMTVSDETGVAYDPSCVQHSVVVTDENLSRGLVFGILDVTNSEITWLEVPNQDQVAWLCDTRSVLYYMRMLRRKCTVGQLLDAKVKAQGLRRVDTVEEADEQYTYEWALNSSNVSALLGE